MEEKEDSKVNCSITRVWWLVNTDGFPMTEKTWERMWDYVMLTHPDGKSVAETIRDKTTQKVPYPSVPVIHSTSPVSTCLIHIQDYLNKLQYNHTGMQFFDIKKHRSISKLMDTAKEMIKESLPIKCLEAVILSLYLTMPLTTLQRFTIRFKSQCNGKWYRHVVLGVYHNGFYGALGLSRRSTLMYKPLEYQTLTDLIQDFLTSYEECCHEVFYIKLSSYITHNVYSCELIQWKFFIVAMKEVKSQTSLKKLLDKYSRLLKSYLIND